ncbi:MAG: hypothetical protein LBI72_02445 [Flavobacteriaceae bacterium]|jgi:hypothetical protein|nr:hypothetical protein [Flavobacteriaceae bacterium]
MKKVLLVLALGALMCSCAKDEVTTSKNEEKTTMGIVDPGDPDMNRIVNGQSVASEYANPIYHFGKGYLMINETNHSIRMNMYVLPKFSFTNGAIDPRLEMRDKYFVFDFLITPKTDHHGKVGGVYGQSAATVEKGPIELWDHMYNQNWLSNNTVVGVLPATPNGYYWTTRPMFQNPYVAGSEFKVAFIEFWVQNGDDEGEHKWLALETADSYNDILLNSSYSVFTPQLLPFAFPINDISFFGIANELPSPSMPDWNIYYMQTNGNPMSNKAYDYNYGVDATFRYMPYVTGPSFKAINPDSSPGYIIKFENL